MRVIMEPADTVGQMKLAEALEALGVVSVDNGKVQMTAGDSAGSLGKLCFNFKRIRKKDIYQAFLDIYASGPDFGGFNISEVVTHLKPR